MELPMKSFWKRTLQSLKKENREENERFEEIASAKNIRKSTKILINFHNEYKDLKKKMEN